jgi:hypothetical protein
MSIASFELPFGLALFFIGVFFGLIKWAHFAKIGEPAPLGTIMFATLFILVGTQFILAFINFDTNSTPRNIRHKNEISN